MYGRGKVEESDNNPLLQKYALQQNHWLGYITVDFISDKIQWQILVQLYLNKSLNLLILPKTYKQKIGMMFCCFPRDVGKEIDC